MGLTPGKPLTQELFDRYMNKDLTWREILFGIETPTTRLTGAKYFKYGSFGGVDVLGKKIGKFDLSEGFEFMSANKMPKSWTSVPSVNLDGDIVENVFTQKFQEKLNYFDKDGRKVTNIFNVQQKTEIDFFDMIANESGKINDIADVTKARTAYGVNFNHSNDSVAIRAFHRWGRKNKVPTSSIHDAVMMNVADLNISMKALNNIYADMLKKNVIIETLDEMKSRGLPKEIYDQYMNEAIDIGLIPIPGRSKIDGRVLTIDDILTPAMIRGGIKDFDAGNDEGMYGWGP
ncbi:MAG: hypothetical protein DRQ64_10625 [Gammaproteobacteria bacterium]|nr:MAG: hypothetical protein DRQ64_10625 [Gammaproteobacteria bacterium]